MIIGGRVITDAVFDYDIQDAEGFTITPLACISRDLRWQVRCGDAAETVVVWMSVLVVESRLNAFIKNALQRAVDRMWSRWMAL